MDQKEQIDEDFFNNIKLSKSIYSIKDKILKKNRSGVELQILESFDGKLFKAIVLTEENPEQKHIKQLKRAIYILQKHSDSMGLPKLYFFDSIQLVVEFIYGEILDSKSLSGIECEELARFIINNICETRVHEGEDLLERIYVQIEGLLENRILKKEYGEQIRNLLQNEIQVPQKVTSCICFADSALKNYIRNKENELKYIDIFGVYREYLGTIFFKQLTKIPSKHKRIFAQSFLANTKSKNLLMNEDLSFHKLMYLINIIYVKSMKKKHGLMGKYREYKKISHYTNDLLQYLDGDPTYY